MSEFKPISEKAIPGALAKAERYRLLNEPREAESICRDILQIDPENQDAVVMLMLALTDQFGHGYGVDLASVRELLPKLRDQYERTYYAGVILERWGKGLPGIGAPNSGMDDWLRQAMGWYDEAEAIRPAGNDDALLRWNACARMLQRSTDRSHPPAAASAQTEEGFDDECPML